MKYSIGDKFVIEGVEGEVKYINAGKAWLAPIIDHDYEDTFRGQPLIKAVTFAMIDENGKMKDGTIAHCMVCTDCQAV